MFHCSLTLFINKNERVIFSLHMVLEPLFRRHPSSSTNLLPRIFLRRLFSCGSSPRPTDLLLQIFLRRTFSDVSGNPSLVNLLRWTSHLRTFSDRPSPVDLLRWTFSCGSSHADLLRLTFFDGPSPTNLLWQTFFDIPSSIDLLP